MKIKLLILLNMIVLNSYGLDLDTQQALKYEISVDHDQKVAKIINSNRINVDSILNIWGFLNPTLLNYAASYNAIKVAELLIGLGAKIDLGEPTPLAMAVRNPEMVELLLRHNADPQEALAQAIQIDNAATAKLLFDKGAKILHKDKAGKTILDYKHLIKIKSPEMQKLIDEQKEKEKKSG